MLSICFSAEMDSSIACYNSIAQYSRLPKTCSVHERISVRWCLVSLVPCSTLLVNAGKKSLENFTQEQCHIASSLIQLHQI